MFKNNPKISNFRNSNTFAICIALMACLIWSGNFVIARGANELVPPITLAFWRWIVAFCALLPFAYKPFKRELHIVLKYWKFTLIMGAFGVAAFNTLIYIAGHYTSAHHIALISSLAPIGTLIIAGILGFDRFSKFKVGGGIMAFSGAVIVVSHGKLETIINMVWNKGDMILLLTATIWASWGAALHFKPKDMSAKVFLFSQIFVGIITLVPFYAWEAINVAPTPFTSDAWMIYLYTGVGASVISWLAWQESVRIIGAVKTSIIYYTIPVFSSILAVLILHEPLKQYHIIGFIFIFIGIIISNLRKLNLVK